MWTVLFVCGLLAIAPVVESQLTLSYNFTIPYDGAGTLFINNQGSSEVYITTLEFTTNSALSGDPWGPLFPYQATISSSTSGILTTVTITIPSPGYSLVPGQSSDLTFTFGTSGGPLGLGMGPSYVGVGVGGASASPINIDGFCETCTDPMPGKSMIGYYPSWGMYARQFDAIDIPVRHINQIIYAFIGYHTDGSLYLLDSNSDGKQIPVIANLKQQYSYLKASLSFGGWTLSGGFSALANNTEAVDTFVSNVMDALQETQFDGVDIDWEYPVLNGAPGEPTATTPQDAEGYANLLQKLRAGLDGLGARNAREGRGATQYYLSIAGAGGVDKLAAIQQYDSTAWPVIIKSVDVVNVMTYDFHGAFDQSQQPPFDVTDFMSAMQTSPQSPFYQSQLLRQYDVIDPINAYLKLGFSSNQLAVGIPAYGRLVMIEQIGSTYGLYQTITGTPNGQYDNTGVFDYRCIQEGQCHGYAGLPSDMVFVDPDTNPLGNDSHTPWGYSQSTTTFLTYDNFKSANYKACWAMKNELAGLMIWDLSGDFPPSDPNSLVGACNEAFNGNC
eukprot:TRINITY_DN101_c0_g1_i1.p1 TRINITY_DN101_c0_g1~~TRINITY_DN101_c0_g1_i1.p1  ORF type:complete len:558 (+),score=151.59 TRINITY_DN101_c0_g1_i1:288-1961(+)